MNMPILAQFGTTEQSMISLEISDLVQSRHDKVKQSIERLVDRGVIAQPPMGSVVKTINGRDYETEVYIFSGEKGKRDSIVVVAQLCPEFTARLVDRWQELENKTAFDITNPAHLPQAIEIQAKQNIALKQELQLQAPKVQYFDRVADVGNLMTASTVGKKLGMSAQALNERLKPLKVYDQRQKGKIFAQWFIDKGFGEVKKTSNGYNTSKFTNKGEQWVIEQLTSTGGIAA